ERESTSRRKRGSRDRQETRPGGSKRISRKTAADTGWKRSRTGQFYRLSRTIEQCGCDGDSPRTALRNTHRTIIRQRIVERNSSNGHTHSRRGSRSSRTNRTTSNHETVRANSNRRGNIDRQDTSGPGRSRSHRIDSETATGNTRGKTRTRQSNRLSRPTSQSRSNRHSTRTTLGNTNRTVVR